MKASPKWIKKGAPYKTRTPFDVSRSLSGANGRVLVVLRPEGQHLSRDAERFHLELDVPEARELGRDLIAQAESAERAGARPFLHVDQARITGDGLGAFPDGAAVMLPEWHVLETTLGKHHGTRSLATTATRDAARRLTDPVVLEALLSMKALLEEIRRRDGEGNVIPENSTGVLHVQRAIAQLEGRT